jgi:hypothetical protein
MRRSSAFILAARCVGLETWLVELSSEIYKLGIAHLGA